MERMERIEQPRQLKQPKEPAMPTIPLIDYYPDCMLPSCDQFKAGLVHQHILPHQQRIHDCTTKYLYIQGGVGSAKTMPLAAETVRLSMEIPNNIGAVSRRDYKLLYRSSWREIKLCNKRLVDRGYIDYDHWAKYMYSHKTQGDYSVITYPNGSELFAIQGKNFTEALGPSYGLFWVDDAMESFIEFFIGDNTSAGLLSRLREPSVHFDPRTYCEHTRPHGSLRGMVSSNPPPINTWLHQLFGKEPGTYKIGDDSYTWMETDTNDNPFVGEDYSKGLIAIQKKMGGTAATINRIIHGKSIPAYPGIPVFPQFDHSYHVAALKVRKDLPIIVAYDFGERHPAVVCSNLYTCKYGTHHYFTLSEVTDAYNCTIYHFQDHYVKPHLETLYKDCTLFYAGDRSGYRSSASNKDRRSDMKILMYEYGLDFSWKYLNLIPSLQYMRGMLEPRKACQCKLPMILISAKCPGLIGALEGGYHFPKNQNNTKPVEDLFFADIACAWRYGAENYTHHGLDWDEQKKLRSNPHHVPTRALPQTTLEWLEMNDKQFAQLITS